MIKIIQGGPKSVSAQISNNHDRRKMDGYTMGVTDSTPTPTVPQVPLETATRLISSTDSPQLLSLQSPVHIDWSSVELVPSRPVCLVQVSVPLKGLLESPLQRVGSRDIGQVLLQVQPSLNLSSPGNYLSGRNWTPTISILSVNQPT